MLVLEANLRGYHAYVKARSDYEPSDDPRVVFVRKPHADREVNGLGFRDFERASEHPPGTVRIIALGDSVTNGFGVAFEDVYTRRLESLLGASGGRYEVVNFGTNQYSIVQEVARFDELGPDTRPDLVILAYVLNDPTPDGRVNEFFQRDRAASLALNWLGRQWERLAPLRRSAYLEGCQPFGYFAEMHCDAAKWASVRGAFEELGSLSRRHGFSVLLVIFPLLETGAHASFADYRWASIHARVSEEARRHGFLSLDLLPYFAQWRPRDLMLSPDDMLHPNSLGHQVAAAAIHERLVSLGVAPPAAPRDRVASGDRGH